MRFMFYKKLFIPELFFVTKIHEQNHGIFL